VSVLFAFEMKDGLRFAIREGVGTVGTDVVAKIIE
jgi:translation elongation factor EF-Tu-like GTPase